MKPLFIMGRIAPVEYEAVSQQRNANLKYKFGCDTGNYSSSIVRINSVLNGYRQ